MTIRKRILALGVSGIFVTSMSLAACGGDSGGGNTDPDEVDVVQVTPDDPDLEVGQTVQLSATPRNDSGDPLNRTVTWSTGSGGVATVTNGGLVTAVGAGTTNITATAGGVGGSVTVTVTAIAVANVAVTPDSTDLVTNGTVQLSAALTGPAGQPLTGRVVTWNTSNAPVATVSAAGLVTAHGVGVATLTASSEGVDGTAKVVVAAPSPVVIDSISPAVVVEGGVATIHGTGFSATALSNAVTIDGIAATVLMAGATQLQVTVPATGCKPARNAPVQVVVAGNSSGAFQHGLRPASFVSLDVGEQAIVTAAQAHCIQFGAAAANEAYLVGLQSTSESVSSLTAARLSATVGAGIGPSAPLPQFNRAVAEQGAGMIPVETARQTRMRSHRLAELDLRERERSLIDQLVAARAQRMTSGLRAASVIPPATTVGDTIQLRVPNVAAANLCTGFFTINAVVRVVGTHGIWLTDVTNPAGGYSDADLQGLSALFDAAIYPTDASYFGDPTDLDSNSRIAILTTRRVNEEAGLLGFVFSGDLFSTAVCPSSNQGEIYYGIAPDPAGTFGSAYPLANALADAPTLIAHEFAHIIQRGHAGHTQSVWEAEGQATFAEEVVGFEMDGLAPGNEYGIDIALDVGNVFDIDWYFTHFFVLLNYFGFPNGAGAQTTGAPEQCSWLGREPNGPCTNPQRMPYDISKSLLGYVTDQYGPSHPGGPAGLQRELITTSSAGFAALEEVTGVDAETILARWSAALYVDGRAGMDPTLQLTSWDLSDISAGVNLNARLTPRPRGFAAFSDNVSVRGGSTAYFTISGAGRSAVSVAATSQAGAALPATMQVWVVRIQ